MPDITRTNDGSIVLAPQFARRLYWQLEKTARDGGNLAREFVTAYDRLLAVAAETHDADLAAEHTGCDGSCAEPNCRNGMPLIAKSTITVIRTPSAH